MFTHILSSVTGPVSYPTQPISWDTLANPFELYVFSPPDPQWALYTFQIFLSVNGGSYNSYYGPATFASVGITSFSQQSNPIVTALSMPPSGGNTNDFRVQWFKNNITNGQFSTRVRWNTPAGLVTFA